MDRQPQDQSSRGRDEVGGGRGEEATGRESSVLPGAQHGHEPEDQSWIGVLVAGSGAGVVQENSQRINHHGNSTVLNKILFCGREKLSLS